MQVSYKLVISYCNIFATFISNDNVNIQNENGEEVKCEWERQVGWHVVGDETKTCNKRVSYYQWIPYVLLLQVRYTINYYR